MFRRYDGGLTFCPCTWWSSTYSWRYYHGHSTTMSSSAMHHLKDHAVFCVVKYLGSSISLLFRYEGVKLEIWNFTYFWICLEVLCKSSFFCTMPLTFKWPLEVDWEWICPIVHISDILKPNKECPSKWNCVMKLKQYGYICYVPNVLSTERIYFAISRDTIIVKIGNSL